jgi:hypothetical protein
MSDDFYCCCGDGVFTGREPYTSLQNKSMKINFAWIWPLGIALFFVGGRWMRSGNLGTNLGQTTCEFKAQGMSDKDALKSAIRKLELTGKESIKDNFKTALGRELDKCGVAYKK